MLHQCIIIYKNGAVEKYEESTYTAVADWMWDRLRNHAKVWNPPVSITFTYPGEGI